MGRISAGMLRVAHIVNSVFTSRSYILACEGRAECWLVDCGDVEPLLERMETLCGSDFRVAGVLLTHAHFDHLYGLPRLREMFPDVAVYTNKWGRAALADERANMSRYHENPIRYVSDRVVVCGEGSVIDLFDGVTAEVFAVPGHNPSSLAFRVGDYLFTGDAYIPGVRVVTTLPGGDKTQARASLERLQALASGCIVCPGHEVE